MQKFLQKPSPSPDRHRKKSAEPSIDPGQHLSSTARSPAAKAVVIASLEPGMSPALLVRPVSAKNPAGPLGLNFASLVYTVVK